MSTWLRDRGIFLLAVFFPFVFLGLTFLAALGGWGPAGLIPLSLAALASVGAFTLALLRLARVPSRDWGRELRLRQIEFEQARQRVFDLTQELRRKSDLLTTERDRSEFLRQSFGELARSLDPRQVLSGILARAIHATGARDGSILLLGERGQVEAFLSRQASGNFSARRAEILDRGLAGWVIRNRRGDIIFDTARDARWLNFPGDREPTRSAVAVPFLRRERALGVMVLTHQLPFQFSEAHFSLLEELAQQAAICLENADLYTAAEAERRKLAAILEGTADAIVVMDVDGRVVLLNPAAERAFGPTAAAALGRPLAEALAHPDFAALFARAVERGEVVTGELTTADGRVRYASISPVPGVGWVAVLQDISYLKELDRLKSEFVTTVSHDLRSPLTAVRGYADLIPMLGPITPEQEDALGRIARAVGQMNDLISDLLDLAKIEAGIDMRREPCRMETIVAEVVEALGSHAVQKELDLRAEIEADLPAVLGHAGRLRQVVANLVDNAIKYTPAGGQVRVCLNRRDAELVLSVVDTGIGIAPQDQEQLFQKFYRVRTPETDAIPGTGLGLALVRSIVEQHGGRIWVRSAPGKGSTFAFSLPVVEGEGGV